MRIKIQQEKEGLLLNSQNNLSTLSALETPKAKDDMPRRGGIFFPTDATQSTVDAKVEPKKSLNDVRADLNKATPSKRGEQTTPKQADQITRKNTIKGKAAGGNELVKQAA